MATSSSQNDSSENHVLLTGGNGFVASHILSDLVNRGYQVTATVRSEDKAQAVLDTNPSWKGHVRFEYVTELTMEGGFDHLFTNTRRPFNYVIHTASPVNFGVEDIRRDLIEPAIKGTVGILESAHKLGGPTIKRFVLLGSAVAVLNSLQDKTKAGEDYTEDDWNCVTESYATERNDVVAGYNVSKKESEMAAWSFMQKNNPHFDLAVINPDIIIGPMIHPISGPNSVNETNRFAIYSFLDGTHGQIEGVEFPFYHFVDVRDVARAHLDSLTNSAASNKRILMVAGLITPQLVVNIVREHFPQLRERVPEGSPSQILPPNNEPTGWDTRVSVGILSEGAPSHRWEYFDLERSVVDTVQCMLNCGLL